VNPFAPACSTSGPGVRDPAGSASRRAAIGVAFALVVGACGPTPSGRPVTSADPAATAPPPLADALRAGVSVDDIMADLAQLQDIADANGGIRAAGTPGYDESATYVADQLEAAGFTVEAQQVPVTVFEQTAPSILAVSGGPTFEDIRDVKAMTFSASGDVTAPVVALGFDPAAQPGDRNGRGCNAGDFAAVPPGVIVLVQPAPCRRLDVVVNAQSAGVAALVTTYAEWPRDAVRRPTLISAADIHIPVLGGTHEVGLALAKAAADGATVHLATSTSVRQVQSANVIGESTWGDPVNVVMLGGHLDSVIDGPGINDNGSGAMTVLEIARTIAELQRSRPANAGPAWKVRVAFWTGEETGLFGSAAYANRLGAGDLLATKAYLNFDMLGSPNGVRIVYQEGDPPHPGQEAAIAGLFGSALGVEGLSWEPEAIGAASDHYPLERAGIPIGGLYSGANEVKSDEEAVMFGGTAGVPDDACYHLACDTLENVDADWLGQLARAAAWVVGRLASGEVVLAPA
jgi:Zn-dependent M28 family amino/carboxypeptidase